jgi:hypothetical protein
MLSPGWYADFDCHIYFRQATPATSRRYAFITMIFFRQSAIDSAIYCHVYSDSLPLMLPQPFDALRDAFSIADIFADTTPAMPPLHYFRPPCCRRHYAWLRQRAPALRHAALRRRCRLAPAAAASASSADVYATASLICAAARFSRFASASAAALPPPLPPPSALFSDVSVSPLADAIFAGFRRYGHVFAAAFRISFSP